MQPPHKGAEGLCGINYHFAMPQPADSELGPCQTTDGGFAEDTSDWGNSVTNDGAGGAKPRPIQFNPSVISNWNVQLGPPETRKRLYQVSPDARAVFQFDPSCYEIWIIMLGIHCVWNVRYTLRRFTEQVTTDIFTSRNRTLITKMTTTTFTLGTTNRRSF